MSSFMSPQDFSGPYRWTEPGILWIHHICILWGRQWHHALQFHLACGAASDLQSCQGQRQFQKLLLGLSWHKAITPQIWEREWGFCLLMHLCSPMIQSMRNNQDRSVNSWDQLWDKLGPKFHYHSAQKSFHSNWSSLMALQLPWYHFSPDSLPTRLKRPGVFSFQQCIVSLINGHRNIGGRIRGTFSVYTCGDIEMSFFKGS